MPRRSASGRQLVQISLNGIEFSEPSRLTTFELYHDYASRGSEAPSPSTRAVAGATLSDAFGQRRLREINFAAGPQQPQRAAMLQSGNPRFGPNSHRPHRVAPDREALMSLVLEQVQSTAA